LSIAGSPAFTFAFFNLFVLYRWQRSGQGTWVRRPPFHTYFITVIFRRENAKGNKSKKPCLIRGSSLFTFAFLIFTFILLYSLQRSFVRHVGLPRPPPFTLFHCRYIQLLLQSRLFQERVLFSGLPETIKHTRGASASTLQPWNQISSSGHSAKLISFCNNKFRKTIGINEEYTTARSLSTGLSMDMS